MPIELPAQSWPSFIRFRILIRPIESTSQTAFACGRLPIRGGSPVSARMLRMPCECAPSSSDWSAIRFRSRVVKWMIVSRPTRRWMWSARLMQPIRTRAIGLSPMLMQSTPTSASSAAPFTIRVGLRPFGGSSSTLTTNFFSASACWSGVGSTLTADSMASTAGGAGRADCR